MQRRVARTWHEGCHQDRTTDPRKKASSGRRAVAHRPSWLFFILVPTARLELAQLAPLPPQDSVSTNFTTSAGDQYFTLPYYFFSMHKLRYYKDISQFLNFRRRLWKRSTRVHHRRGPVPAIIVTKLAAGRVACEAAFYSYLRTGAHGTSSFIRPMPGHDEGAMLSCQQG